ncbi:MAG: CTB family bacteriocin [Cyanobacteria bacterium J06621_15]
MSNEINNVNAIELSEQELDVVAGGSGFPGFGFSGSDFKQFAIAGGSATMAGPGGASTQHMIQAQGVDSSAFKGLGSFGSDTFGIDNYDGKAEY